MYNHEPADYDCPMCRFTNGHASELNHPDFVFYEDEFTLAFVAPKWWINNPGSAIVIPKKHVENLYDISDELLGHVYQTVKKVAVAMKATYQCAGISTRQHNEPSGNQDVWHFHTHVFPRHEGDELYKNHDQREWVDRARRMEYVEKLKKYLATQ